MKKKETFHEQIARYKAEIARLTAENQEACGRITYDQWTKKYGKIEFIPGDRQDDVPDAEGTC